MVQLVQWLSLACVIVAALDILLLPWFAILRKTRHAAGVGYVLSSYVFGATVWFLCLLTVWDAWGGFWALVSVLMLGVGPLPIALLIFALGAQWVLFIEVLLLGAMTFGVRMLGLWLIGK